MLKKPKNSRNKASYVLVGTTSSIEKPWIEEFGAYLGPHIRRRAFAWVPGRGRWTGREWDRRAGRASFLSQWLPSSESPWSWICLADGKCAKGHQATRFDSLPSASSQCHTLKQKNAMNVTISSENKLFKSKHSSTKGEYVIWLQTSRL